MNEEPKSNKRHLHISALVLAILLIFVLFKLNLEKVVNSPQFQNNIDYIEEQSKTLWIKIKADFFDFKSPFDQAKLEMKIKPDKINEYFGNASDETINQLSSPVAQ